MMYVPHNDTAGEIHPALVEYANTVSVITFNPFSSLSLLHGFINEVIRETVASSRWHNNNEDTYRLVAQLRYAANEIDKVIASGVYTAETAQD